MVREIDPLPPFGERFSLLLEPQFSYTSRCAAGVVEDATVKSLLRRCHHARHLILNMFEVGFCCWLIFTLAAYALPFSVGLTADMAAFHSGSRVLGALPFGVVAGASTLGVGQIAFALAKPLTLRAAIAVVFSIPAAIAGYHAREG